MSSFDPTDGRGPILSAKTDTGTLGSGTAYHLSQQTYPPHGLQKATANLVESQFDSGWWLETVGSPPVAASPTSGADLGPRCDSGQGVRLRKALKRRPGARARRGVLTLRLSRE